MPDRHALVTGASQGLGHYLATSLAAEGWLVTGVGRRPHSKVERGSSGRPATGDKAAAPEPAAPFDYIQADLALPETPASLAARLPQTPNLIVHCAVLYSGQRGTAPPLGGLEDVFRVNALAPYLLTLALLDAKPFDSFTSCVVVNSEAIYGADQRSAPYAASKAALRVLTAGLADASRSRNAAVSTLLLGPLSDARKRAELDAVAEKRGITREEVTRLFLRRSNPHLVIDTLIDYEPCLSSIRYLADLGPTANGMVCKLDGGSSGSLT